MELLPRTAALGESENEAATDWNEAVKHCVIFDSLPVTELNYVSQATKLINSGEAGTTIYKQGDTATQLYLVHSGVYSATTVDAPADNIFRLSTKDDAMETQGHLSHARDFCASSNFGGPELLCHMGGRRCTITVIKPGKLWAVPRRLVESKLRIPPPRKDAKAILDFCESVRLFRGISKERMLQLCRSATQKFYKKDEYIFKEGDVADKIHAVMKGSVVTHEAESDFQLTMSAPDVFGETSLLSDDSMRQRQAHATGGEHGATVVSFKVSEIETLIGFDLQYAARPVFYRRLLASTKCARHSLAENLKKDDLETVLKAMVETSFEPKQVIALESEYDAAIHLIKHGEVIVRRDKQEGDHGPIATLHRGDCFGEQALLPPEEMKPSKRRTTVVASAREKVVTLSLTPASFAELRALGSIGEDDFLEERSVSSAVGVSAGLETWAEKLIHNIKASIIPGIDSIVAEKVESAGGEITAVIPSFVKAKKERGKRSKKGARQASESSIVDSSQRTSQRRPSLTQEVSSGLQKTGKSLAKAVRRASIALGLVAATEAEGAPAATQLMPRPDEREDALQGEMKPRKRSIVQMLVGR
jgi:CRP-like cAMP-binding protein